MARITTNMALAVWNLVSDLFDHSQLASNLDKIDAHDHTNGKGIQIPGGGIQDSAISSNHISASGLTAIANIIIPPGTMLPYGGTSAPTNFLICDGSAVSRATYANLFSALGTTFGVGDGTTTFNIPDLRGRTVIGKDPGAAHLVSAPALGATLGEEKHTLTYAELPAGYHLYNLGNVSSLAFYGTTTNGPPYPLTTDSPGSVNAGPATSGTAHNNLQPSVAINYIIKT